LSRRSRGLASFALLAFFGAAGVLAALLHGHAGGALVIALVLAGWLVLAWMFWRESPFFGSTARRSP
jgi:hypothetical protein